jgi:SAM-dependent methyltransferase
MTTMIEIPESWLVDPVTKQPLTRDGDTLRAGDRAYHRDPDHGFWIFLPQDLPELESAEWKVWEKLQENGVVSYEAAPTQNLGVGEREDFRLFADWSRFHGNVLDVGVGPQKVPSHMRYAAGGDATFWGIDPLRGEQPREYGFVQGLGEFLPFGDGIFDQVLFVTSLDHFIDPRVPLREARRVLAAGGEVCVWLGEKDSSAPKPAHSHAWYEQLEVPQGAEDRFHMKRFTHAEFLGMLPDAGLRVADEVIHDVDQWRRHVFCRLVPA